MRVLEFLIKIFGSKKRLSNEEKFQDFLKQKKNKKKDTIPKMKFKSNISIFQIYGHDIFHFSNQSSSKVIIYLHGGYYANEPRRFHFRFVDKLCKESNMDVYFPMYPLAPEYHYKEAYEFLQALYENLQKDKKEIILIGDSAGGGFALAFTEYLNEQKQKIPLELILISPWVDVSMSNPDIKKYEKVDPMLSKYGLIEFGKLWAKELDLKDYRVSPIYGNLSGLPKIILNVGTKELFYPDVCFLYDRLKEEGISVHLMIGKNMTHIYPLYRMRKGKQLRKEILKK